MAKLEEVVMRDAAETVGLLSVDRQKILNGKGYTIRCFYIRKGKCTAMKYLSGIFVILIDLKLKFFKIFFSLCTYYGEMP